MNSLKLLYLTEAQQLLLQLALNGSSVAAESLAKCSGGVIASMPTTSEQKRRGVGRLRIEGALTYAPDEIDRYFGALDVREIRTALRELVADDTLSSIVIEWNSPGGSVVGIAELAAEIHELQKKKPIISIADPMAASAAYWLAAASTKLYVLPSGYVGSVGVFIVHVDYSGMMEQRGVKVTFIKAGEKKVAANPYEALSESAAADLQAEVDRIYEQFTSEVARFRGKTQAAVKSDFGKGAIVSAEKALTAGMVDAIMQPGAVLIEQLNAASADNSKRAFLAREKFILKHL